LSFLKKVYFNELRSLHDCNFWKTFLLTNTIDLNKKEYAHLTKKQKFIAEELNTLINDIFIPESEDNKLSPIDFKIPMSSNILS
jgi:hypothetical protein